MPDKQTTLATLHDVGIVPVIRASSPEKAIKIVEAIRSGGVNVFEITMTVPGAIGVIQQLHDHYGEQALLGAGTVLDAATARQAVQAGASFVVGPSLDLGVIEACKQLGVAVCPGALSPTEVVAAWRAGADVVKIFPCGNVGGADYIKALKAPLPQIEMMPTGGVDLSTAADFIKAGSFCLGVGAALVDKQAVEQGNYPALTDLARKFVEIIRTARA